MYLMYLDFETFKKNIPRNPSMDFKLKVVDYSSDSEFNDKIELHRKIFVPNYDLEAHIKSLKISYGEGNGFGLFLYFNDDLVGALDVEKTNDFVYIMNFGIVPSFRGKGFGKEFLMESLFTIIDKIGHKFDGIYLLVSKKNLVAKNLYESLGFSVKI